MVETAPLPPPCLEPSPHVADGEHGHLAEASTRSEFEDVLASGYRGLRFPLAMEARYIADKAPERLHLIRIGGILVILLTNFMLLADWLMVPDQFGTALKLRAFVHTPLILFCLIYLNRMSSQAREWSTLLKSLVSAGIAVYLSLSSTDVLAPAYLATLTLILLFNGGVIRMRFWMALRLDLIILAMFAAAVIAMPNPPVPVMASLTLVMVAITLFTLFGSYRSEHEDRANWLMQQHQRVLLDHVERGNQQLDRLSRFDPLTELANRRHLDEFLQQVWTRAQRDGEELALMMIDIDHFKLYNDHYGHPAGDACLQEVARALRASLRKPEDLIARFGGEEFVVVLTRTSLDAAMAAAERVRQSVAAIALPHEASPTLGQLTLSIGVASVKPAQTNTSAARLMASADEALYEAKASGRNQACAYTQAELSQAGTTEVSPPPPPRPPAPLEGERADVEAASTSLNSTFSTLRFPARLEQQFLRDGAEQRVRYFGVCGVLAFFIFNGFLLSDYLMVPDAFWLAVQVRLALFTPLAAIVLLTLRFQGDWLRRTFQPMALEGVVLVSGVVAAACLAFILSASHSPLSQYYHVGFMVVIVYGNVVQRLRFWYALAFSLAVYTIHIAGVVMLPMATQRLAEPILALMAASVIFTLMSNYALERGERRHYLLSLTRRHVMQDLRDVRLRLHTLSRMDTLTGLYNRRHFQEYLQQAWRRAQHDGKEVCIIMVDIDHFKAYNDRYGHPAGDACLARVAQAMGNSLRQPGDMVARLGGEEFIAVLPSSDGAAALKAAERVRQAIAALAMPHEASSTDTVVTVSLGVAALRAHPHISQDTLVAAADAALYEAKRAGRNRVATSPQTGA